MDHKGVHIQTVTHTNGVVAFHAYCADDTDRHVSVHTCYVEKQFGVLKCVEEINNELQQHLQRVAQLHAARQLAENVAATLTPPKE